MAFPEKYYLEASKKDSVRVTAWLSTRTPWRQWWQWSGSPPQRRREVESFVVCDQLLRGSWRRERRHRWIHKAVLKQERSMRNEDVTVGYTRKSWDIKVLRETKTSPLEMQESLETQGNSWDMKGSPRKEDVAVGTQEVLKHKRSLRNEDVTVGHTRKSWNVNVLWETKTSPLEILEIFET